MHERDAQGRLNDKELSSHFPRLGCCPARGKIAIPQGTQSFAHALARWIEVLVHQWPGGRRLDCKFATPYGKIPKHRRPIIIGSFRFPQDDVMWLDVRSHERATKAIVFFDRRLPRSVAQVTHAAIVNRLFGVSTATLPPLDTLFDEAKILEKNPEEILQAAEQFGTIPDVRERMGTS